jgi:hypothetical protein
VYTQPSKMRVKLAFGLAIPIGLGAYWVTKYTRSYISWVMLQAEIRKENEVREIKEAREWYNKYREYNGENYTLKTLIDTQREANHCIDKISKK